MSEYQMLVLVERNREEDEEYFGKTDLELMQGLAKELQQGWDEASISGHFRVQCVVKKV